MPPGPSRAALAVLLLVGCNPNTTRPRLVPFPEAQETEMRAAIPKAVDELARALRADSVPVRRIETQDGWMDTGWFDVATLTPATGQFTGPGIARVRAFIGPSRPKYAELTVEAVYRRMIDPSVPERELERPLPPDSPVRARIARVLDRLGERKGLSEVRDSVKPPRPPR